MKPMLDWRRWTLAPVLLILTLLLTQCQMDQVTTPVLTPAQAQPAAPEVSKTEAPTDVSPATEPPTAAATSAPTMTQTAQAPDDVRPTAVTSPTTMAGASADESSDATPAATAVGATLEVQEYPVPRGSHPHDVAPAADGGVWYTAQAASALGWLDPATGEIELVPLGAGAAPHGVIVGPDGAAWITDGGLNAIVRVDPQSRAVQRFDMPAEHAGANLNTAVFDPTGRLWFTGQSGVYGVLDPATGEMQVYRAPKGRGPYGITATPDGRVFYASLAGSYVGQIDPPTGEATVIEPPILRQGARRVWSDSTGKVWVSYWNTGHVARYDPATGEWTEWRLPGDRPTAYAVYVDWQDRVWLSDFNGNSLVRFDPQTEQFESVPLPSPSGSVRQIHGRPGEIWGAESAADKVIVVRVK